MAVIGGTAVGAGAAATATGTAVGAGAAATATGTAVGAGAAAAATGTAVGAGAAAGAAGAGAAGGGAALMGAAGFMGPLAMFAVPLMGAAVLLTGGVAGAEVDPAYSQEIYGMDNYSLGNDPLSNQSHNDLYDFIY